MDEDKTLGDWFPTSIAPSALSLLHVQPSGEIRDGVYTLGNPRGDLRFAEAEAYALQYIARKLGITSHCTMQEAVTSTALRKSLKHALVIDLACHGKVNPDDYLQSCLMLAHDPPLTLGTILNWGRDMQGLRLLILSACESATADLQGAVDEVRSLTPAMLQAGACAVLAPLWRVDDRATFLLMTRFATEWFPQIRTEPPAVALARAQRWLRNVTNEELKHWEARALPLSPVPGPQKLRSDMSQAEEIIRTVAARNPSHLRPYADPIFWAGFQIAGW
jgi:CHAT domain-containing protein